LLLGFYSLSVWRYRRVNTLQGITFIVFVHVQLRGRAAVAVPSLRL